MGDEQRNWVGVLPAGDDEKPTGANPLIVKLKVKNPDHVCKICNKAFSCGKALGGHMRVHNSEGEGRRQQQVARYYSSSVKSSKLGNNGDSCNGDNTTCQLCGKVFPSMKSLFGHMRCHPEREWRGINPPAPPPQQPIVKNSSSSTLSDSAASQSDSATTGERLAVKEEDGPFKNWPANARRGRKILGKRKSEQLNDPIQEAVQTLLLLSRGDHRKDEDEEEENEKSYIGESGRKVEDGHSSDGYELADMYQSEEESDTKISSYMKQLGYKIEMNKKIRKTKKRKLRALEAVVTAGGGGRGSGRYRCTTCNKTFHTHQALGGHMANHKKNKSPSPTAWAEEEEEEEVEGDDEEEVPDEEAGTAREESMESEEATPPHQCEICNKTFPSGQALGGHKRCHWVGLGDAALSSSSSQKAVIAAEAGRRIMDFDLNELPPAENGEDVKFPCC